MFIVLYNLLYILLFVNTTCVKGIKFSPGKNKTILELVKNVNSNKTMFKPEQMFLIHTGCSMNMSINLNKGNQYFFLISRMKVTMMLLI